MMLLLLLCIVGSVVVEAVDEVLETDDTSSRKVLGSSVVTSVSVVMDTGNGSTAVFTDAAGKPMSRPSAASDLASPINLLNPDRYEFYTFDDSGDLVKRLMTLDEIQGIIASGDGDGFLTDPLTYQDYLPEKRVDDVVNNVQNVLKEEIEFHKDAGLDSKPIFDTPDVSSSWSMILPAIFGNSGQAIKPEKPVAHVTPDTIMIEPTTKVITTTTQTEAKTSASTTPRTSSSTIKYFILSERPTQKTKVTPTVSSPSPSINNVEIIANAEATEYDPNKDNLLPIYRVSSSTPSTPRSTTESSPSHLLTSSTKPVSSSTAPSTVKFTTKISTAPTTVKFATETLLKATPQLVKSTTETFSSTTEKVPIISTQVTPDPLSKISEITTRVSPATVFTTTNRNVASSKTPQPPLTTTFKIIPETTTTESLESTTLELDPTTELVVKTTNLDLNTESTEFVTFTSLSYKSSAVSGTTQSNKLNSTEKLDNLLLTSTNIYEINSELSEKPNLTTVLPLDNATEIISFNNESSTTESLISSTNAAKINPVTEITTELPTTEQSLIHTIDKLIADALADNPESSEPNMDDSLSQDYTKINFESNAKKNMSDVLIYTATVASNMIDGNQKDSTSSDDFTTLSPVQTSQNEIQSTTYETTTYNSFVENTEVNEKLEQVDLIATTQRDDEPIINATLMSSSTTEKYVPHIINITIVSDSYKKPPAKIDLSSEESLHNINGTIAPNEPEENLTTENVSTSKFVTTLGTRDITTTAKFELDETTTETVSTNVEELITKFEAVNPITTVKSVNNQVDNDIKVTSTSPIANESSFNIKRAPTTPSVSTIISKNKTVSSTPSINIENITEVPISTTISENKTDVPISTTISENKTEAPSSTLNVNKEETTWSLVSTISPHTSEKLPTPISNPHPITSIVEPPKPVDLVPKPLQGFGLEDSTSHLDTDIYQFAQLCNELAFAFWKSVTNGISQARSVVVSPFAATSLLAMVFLGARGATSGEMNEILKLDDMVTFNPHLIFKNVSESIDVGSDHGVAVSTIVRELYSDRVKGSLLSFYKERARQFYDGHVEEAGFREIGDVIRRRTNLLIKKHTNGKISEFLKDNSITVKPPLAAVSTSIFQTDCSHASIEGRDGELHFIVLPSIRQRRLIPVPAVVYRTGFLAGYEPSLDATAVAIGSKDHTVSTIFIIPGQQGIAAPGDGLTRLEKRLVESSFKKGAWSRLLRALIPRPGLEVQIPRFSHRSIINATLALKRMGLKDLFDAEKADLRGLNGAAHELYLSDMLQINNFATCGEDRIGDTHHSEIYPATGQRSLRKSRMLIENQNVEVQFEEPRDYQRAFNDPLHDPSYLALPLPLRPRQARIPEAPRLRFDRPFLYLVRHNPTGLILHMGRFNPRLLP